MPQQLILELEHYYPFGEIEPQGQDKIFVRKRLHYENLNEQKNLKQKVAIIRKLKHPILIPLLRVLEEQGSFHLIYEYVPHRFESYLDRFSNQQIEQLKKKTLAFASYLCDNKIDVNLEARNVGFTSSLQLKCYVDVDFIISDKSHETLKNLYVLQINKIFQKLKMYVDKKEVDVSKMHFSQKRNNLLRADQTKSNRVRLKKDHSVYKDNSKHYSPQYIGNYAGFEDREDSRYTSHQSKYRQKSIWTAKSKQYNNNNSRPKVNHQELLNNLQIKIQEITQKLKKCNNQKKIDRMEQPKHTSPTLRESAKDKQSKYIDKTDRKMSAEIPYNNLTSFGKSSIITENGSPSVRARQQPVILENIKENSEQSTNNLGTGATPSERKQSLKIRKQSIKIMKESVKLMKKQNSPTTYQRNGANNVVNIYSVTNNIAVPMHTIPGKLKSSTIQQQSPKFKKQPLTKKDFQELKKNQFENFFSSKESYVQEFLGVLDDKQSENTKSLGMSSKQGHNQQPVKTFAKQINQYDSSKMEKNKERYMSSFKLNQPSIQEILEVNSLNQLSSNQLNSQPTSQVSSKSPRTNYDSTEYTPKSIRASQSKESQEPRKPNLELKNRISKVIQKCDMALMNYRKNSIHSTSTQAFKK